MKILAKIYQDRIELWDSTQAIIAMLDGEVLEIETSGSSREEWLVSIDNHDCFYADLIQKGD